MNAEEIQAFSQSIAFHPLIAIGGLMILISIARKMDLNYKEEKKVAGLLLQSPQETNILKKDKYANSESYSLDIASNDLTTSMNT